MRAAARPSLIRSTSIVARPALFELLTAGLGRGVTLVSAPPGSGKTVLLRSWIDATGLRRRAAWVAVEADERDGQRFWLAVVEALRGAAGKHGFVEKLDPAPQFDGSAVVERIVSELHSLDEPVVLVIDDLHALVSQDALAQLDELLARRPPQLHVILSTRHDPALGLHRLRLEGELTELRVSELRFTIDEARQLFASTGIALGDDAIASLVARTEGWAAGLRLAAIALTSHSDTERFVAEFSGSARGVAEYLLGEVLACQREPVRELLLRTSILERVNGALADRLLGTTGSEATLLELEGANMFVFSIDPARSWFRYHQLFRDLLRLELRRTSPEAVPTLNRAAAEWFAEHGLAIDAIRHAEAAEDWAFAGELLAEHGPSLALDGHLATMDALLAALPPGALSDAEVAAFRAFHELTQHSVEAAAPYLAIAEQGAWDVPDRHRSWFEVELAVVRLVQARRRGDYAGVLTEVGPLLEPGGADSLKDLAVHNDARALALMNLGIVELWSSRPDGAEQHLRQALDLARRIARPFVEVACLSHLALAAGRGSVAQELELCSEAIALAEAHGWTSDPNLCIALATRAGCDVWQGRFEEADAWLHRAEQALRPDAEPATGLLLHFVRGIQHAGEGRFAPAADEFAATERLQALLLTTHPLTIQSRGFLVQTQLRLNDLDAARATLATLADQELNTAEIRAAVASVRLAEGNARAAVEGLAPVLAGSVPAALEFSIINALLVDALARAMLGESSAAEVDMERALDLAEPNAIVFPFVMTPTRDLLERHPRHRTAHPGLIATILDVLAGSSLPARAEKLPELHERLTESEVRVLRHLPSHLSASEIAAELFVATSTVKTHMHHIYEKLGVRGRTEAVDRARELRLLAASPTRR